jgi:hypothetical protein
MTKGTKGRGSVAPPAKPSPIAELRRRWRRYAVPLRLLEQLEQDASLPLGTDYLRLAQRMIEACENCRTYFRDHAKMADEMAKDAKSASRNARDLARFLRRYWKSTDLRNATVKAYPFFALALAKQNAVLRPAGLPPMPHGNLEFLPTMYADMLANLSHFLPRIATSGTAHRRRHGILFGASLLRKGRPTTPETACLFAVVFHARQATGPLRDAWARNDNAAIFGPMPKEGRPLYKIAAAFVCAAFPTAKETLEERQAADRLAVFLKRNPTATLDEAGMSFSWE